MSWKNKVYRAQDRRYLRQRREEEERTDEDESGGWFRSVSGCVGWFAAREMEGRACERESEREREGKVSRGGWAGVPRVIDCLLRKDEASSLPAAEVISFEKARAFSPGSGFEEERTLGDGTIECIIL